MTYISSLSFHLLSYLLFIPLSLSHTVMSATASVVYPDKHHNYVNITLSSNTDMSYKYLHFNSSNHILQYSKNT